MGGQGVPPTGVGMPAEPTAAALNTRFADGEKRSTESEGRQDGRWDLAAMTLRASQMAH